MTAEEHREAFHEDVEEAAFRLKLAKMFQGNVSERTTDEGVLAAKGVLWDARRHLRAARRIERDEARRIEIDPWTRGTDARDEFDL